MVVVFGIALMSVVIFANFRYALDIGENILPMAIGWVIFGIWNISPHFAYFFATKRISSLIKLLLPAFLLCGTQLFFILDYFHSLSSTAALIFIFAPIYEAIAIAFGFLLGFFIEKIKAKKVKR